MKSLKFYLLLIVVLLINIGIQASYANTTEISNNTHLIDISIKNKGGFALRTKRFFKKNDNSFTIKTKSFPVAQTKNFNIPEYSEVYLHAIAVGGWSKCALVEKDGCTINCSRGSLNMNCYFSEKNCGSIRGISDGSCNYAAIKYLKDDSDKEISSIDIAPKDKGTITIKNTGATAIKHFKLHFLSGEDEAHNLLVQQFTGNCFNITELNAGQFCKLSYNIPSYITLKPVYQIAITGDHITQNNPLTINMRSIYLSHFNNPEINRCLIKKDGSFTNCHDMFHWINKIKNIGVADLKLQQYKQKIHVYFIYRSQNIYACELSPYTGIISSCSNIFDLNKNTDFSSIKQISFSKDGDIAYIGGETNYSPGDPIKKQIIAKCVVSKINGSFKQCEDSQARKPLTITDYKGILTMTFNNYNNKIYFIYTKRETSKTGIIVCNTDQNKNLSSCKVAFNIPETTSVTNYYDYSYDIKFISKDFVYVLSNLGRVDLCHVIPETGMLNNCKNSNATKLKNPISILIDKKTQHSYVINQSGDNTVTCNILDDNFMQNCELTSRNTNKASSMQLFPIED